MKKIGRNDPCHCGSGKKYKKCCLNNNPQLKDVVNLNWKKMRDTDDQLNHKIFTYVQKEFPEYLAFAWSEFQNIEYDDIEEIDYEDYVFICAFMPWFLYNWEPLGCNEDLETDIEGTLAEAFLKRYHYTLSQFEKKFILANLKSFYNYYEVLATNPNHSLKVKDLLLDNEIIVNEKSASNSLTVGYVTYSRIVTIDDCTIFVGTYPQALPADFISTAIDFKQTTEINEKGSDGLYEFEYEIRELYLQALESYNNFKMPKLRNTDGEDLIPSQVYFGLHCSLEESIDKLSTLNLNESKDEILENAVFNENGKIDKVEFPWLVKGNKLNKSWDNTVFAHLIISNHQLIIEVNSQERANKAKTEIEKLLGNLATYKTTVIEPLDNKLNNKLDNKHEHKSTAIDINEHPELKEQLQKMHDDHWKNWLDMEIPALDNQTPRQASQTDKGKEQLEALFSSFHQKNLQIKESKNSQQLPVDLHYLRKSLGML